MHSRFLKTTVLGLLLAGAAAIVAQPHWEVKQTFHVGGEGGWDYVTVDAVNHRLFVTRTTHTQAIDTQTGKVLGDIPGQIRSHGVALVPKRNRGFLTDGGGKGAIIVFDLSSYAVLGKLAALPDADGIIYDAKTDQVLAVSGDGNALMAFPSDIDPTSGRIEPIKLDGAPEFLAVDGQGKAYINLEDKNLVTVVDLTSHKVISSWPVAPGGHPVGMSIDAQTHRLFIGCRNPQELIVMNTRDGSIEGSVPIGAGVDATGFLGDQAFASCRDGSLSVAGAVSGKFAIEETVKTPDGARTMGIDPISHRIFLPTAEFEPSPTGGRPVAKAGTFMIVVVGN